ncbi:MAG: hypothetical protein RMH75_05440 [Archaeoglobaceae archaeon]|nr:hypothetical protein [Archaeoglobaceae archaeon]MDW7990087.1 hypothetical protein [Archaeoglobaceae archaeon]
MVELRWQDFEVEVKRICEEHNFLTFFRHFFKDELGKAEIDVVAERGNILLCIDAKLYSRNRYRVSQIKREAKKHSERCKRFSRIKGKRAVPVIITSIDDSIYYYEGCIIVPYHSFNYFLSEVYYYLTEFGYLL